MNEDSQQYLIDISTKLGEISGKLTGILDTLDRHEKAIHELQTQKTGVMTGIVPFLLKLLLIALTTICTLSGSGALLQQIIGK